MERTSRAGWKNRESLFWGIYRKRCLKCPLLVEIDLNMRACKSRIANGDDDAGNDDDDNDIGRADIGRNVCEISVWTVCEPTMLPSVFF